MTGLSLSRRKRLPSTASGRGGFSLSCLTDTPDPTTRCKSSHPGSYAHMRLCLPACLMPARLIRVSPVLRPSVLGCVPGAWPAAREPRPDDGSNAGVGEWIHQPAADARHPHRHAAEPRAQVPPQPTRPHQGRDGHTQLIPQTATSNTKHTHEETQSPPERNPDPSNTEQEAS